MMTLNISNSEIASFLRCRRKWWFEYYLGGATSEVPVVGPLPMGSRLHTALERWYSLGIDPVDTWNELVAGDRLILMSRGVDTAALDSESDMGRVMLEGYMEWVHDEGVDAGLEILGVEDFLEMDLRPGVRLIGKADLRARYTDLKLTRVIDFKSAAQFTSFDYMGAMAPQSMTYLIMDELQRQEGDISDGFEFRLLKKSKRTARATGPFYAQYVFRHNRTELANFRMRINGIVDDMLRVRDALDRGDPHHVVAYPHVHASCTWQCPLSKVCTMFDDGSAIESFLDNEFTMGNDPYARYGMMIDE
jgi:hypothetical protein